MIKIKNTQLQNVAILENAFGIGYNRRNNEIWSASFSLPLDDPKNENCAILNYVEIMDDLEYVGLFRIDPTDSVKDEQQNKVTYYCTHVFSTLMDDVLFLYHEALALSTADTIQYLLSKQMVKHWELGTVDISRSFSYKWENENIISALFSITKPFDVPVRWTYNTTVYPWKLNLVAWPSQPTCEIRYAKNLRGIERKVDPTGIVNRWYALGYGEGINQLTIKKVNGGLPYIEDTASITKYGVRADIFVDKSIENVQTLLSTVQATLAETKDPKVTYRISAADLTSITKEDVDKLKEGRVVRVVDPDFGMFTAPIVSDAKSDMTGQPYGVTLEVANKVDDLFGGQIEMIKRQRINDLYAQGSLSIDSHGFSDNCDSTHAAIIRFFVPEDLVNVNTLDLTFETAKFRAYSKSAQAGGGQTTSAGGGQTTSAGGGQTTSAGGGTTATSSSGGGSTITSTSASPGFYLYTSTKLPLTGPTFENHYHAVEVTDELNHNHSVTVANHSHSVTIANHSHTVAAHTHSVADHSHTVSDHVHPLDFGVYEHATLPTSVTIKVDNNAVPGTALRGENIDLIPYLSKDADGKVKRNAWHEVTLLPNGLARINAQVISRIFIQSRLGGNY